MLKYGNIDMVYWTMNLQICITQLSQNVTYYLIWYEGSQISSGECSSVLWFSMLVCWLSEEPSCQLQSSWHTTPWCHRWGRFPVSNDGTPAAAWMFAFFSLLNKQRCFCAFSWEVVLTALVKSWKMCMPRTLKLATLPILYSPHSVTSAVQRA